MELFKALLPIPTFLMRHGLSTGQVLELINQRCSDSYIGLAPTGLAQAQNAAISFWKEMDGKNILIVSSDYRRADETAAQIVLTDPQQKCDWLRHRTELVEIHFGKFEGLSWKEQKELYPSEAALSEKYFHGTQQGANYYHRMPFGDAYAEQGFRFLTLIANLPSLVDLEKYDAVCFVAHGGTMRAITKVWYSLTLPEFKQLKNPDNCAIWRLSEPSATNRAPKIISPGFPTPEIHRAEDMAYVASILGQMQPNSPFI